MSQPLILVVEDEPAILKFLCTSLQRHQYQVLCSATGAEATLQARSHNPDLVLLDLGLPDMDGMDFLKAFRTWSETPVIILSARNQEQQKVKALDMGADDYLAKPFGLDELLARLRVAFRRSLRQDTPSPDIHCGNLRISLDERRVWKDQQEIRLTPLEYKLLAALARRNGKVVTHQQLLQEVWGPAQGEQTQYLHIYMGQLRRKLETDPARPKHFKTEPGVGYRLETDLP